MADSHCPIDGGCVPRALPNLIRLALHASRTLLSERPTPQGRQIDRASYRDDLSILNSLLARIDLLRHSLVYSPGGLTRNVSCALYREALWQRSRPDHVNPLLYLRPIGQLHRSRLHVNPVDVVFGNEDRYPYCRAHT